VTGCKVQPFIGTMSDIQDAIIKYYGPSQESVEKIEAMPPQAPVKAIDAGDKKGVEKRRFIRLSANLSFHYAFQEEYKKAESKNISAIGVLFKSENIIPLWTFLIIKIRLPQQKAPIKVVGQVVRIDSMPDKTFDVAVHLTHASAKEREAINQYVLDNLHTPGHEEV
ncbi:MAG: PilZ domain-containing protein, partial [Candidatus Omnitrophica bacterium]|nr:PilZ domain-containing protein [Candidatus Omnitrophota bacterium]